MAKNVSKTTKTGVNPEWLERMKRTGALKQFGSLAEMRAARAAREKRGVVETPAHLLPDDHFRKRKRVNTTLSTKARAIAKKIGNGNVSQGIERALLHFHENPPSRKGKRQS